MSSEGQGFYTTLPSESSKELFPENNPLEYTVRLPQWVHLNGHWEIGLHSIAYTSWNIIRYLDGPIFFMEGGKEGKGGKMRKHYSSVKEYVDSINASLKESHIDKSPVDKSNEIEFSYELNGKVTVCLSPGYTVRLRREQAIVLGFMTFEDSSETYDVENARIYLPPDKTTFFQESFQKRLWLVSWLWMQPVVFTLKIHTILPISESQVLV